MQALSLVLDVLCGITAKEADAAVREALAEAVLCVARADAGRKALWAVDGPTLLGKGCAGPDARAAAHCVGGRWAAPQAAALQAGCAQSTPALPRRDPATIQPTTLT